MREKIIYKLSDKGNYSYKGPMSQQMFIITEFLESDVQVFEDDFLIWINGSSISAGGNVCFLEKKGDYINIFYEFDDPMIPVSIKKIYFIEMLQEWKKIFKNKPSAYSVTWDGEKVTFEALDKIEE